MASTRTTNHSGVSLPAGSYDRGKLQAGLDAAADSNDTNRAAEVDKALEKSVTRVDGAAASPNPSLLPDHKLVEVPTQLDDEKNVVATETVQVFDQDKADRHVAAQQPVLPSRVTDDDGKPSAVEKARATAVKGDGLAEAPAVPAAPEAPATETADAETTAAATSTTKTGK